MASSLELNKLLAGVLTAGVIAVGAAVFSGLLYYPRQLEEHAFSIDTGEEEAATAEAADEAADEPSIAVRLASADPAAGQAITRQCAACHVFDEGGANRVGPALWDVVGREIGAASGFAYSAALDALEGDWTFEKLDAYLTNPREYAPGTSMAFAGLRSPEDRANLLAYMREQSNDPVPLPEVDAETAAAEPAEEAAPAEETVTAAAEEAAELTAVPEVPEERVVEAPEAVQAPAEAAGLVQDPPAADAEVSAVTAVEPAEEAATDVADATTEAADAPGGGELSPMQAMVAAADPAAGQGTFRQCAACHTVDQGGQNRVGPNLWGVFGADVGHHEGFNYSDALLAIDGIWTVEKLNAYLENPRGYAPGNRMAFAGLRNEEDRAAMIAYLRSLSEDPRPVDIQ
jgi:cytochrome c